MQLRNGNEESDCIKTLDSHSSIVATVNKTLSAGSDKNHAGDFTWWSTKLDDFHFTER